MRLKSLILKLQEIERDCPSDPYVAIMVGDMVRDVNEVWLEHSFEGEIVGIGDDPR